jgi:hypothetical protein
LVNKALGERATVPGGVNNTASGDYSFAAGQRAKANHNGTFVWADSTATDFASQKADAFLIRASGGVGIGTSAPAADLEVYRSAGAKVRIHSPVGTPALEIAASAGSVPHAYSLLVDPSENDGKLHIRDTTSAPGTDRLVIDVAGNVGIGTTVPAHPLEMASGAHCTAGGTWTNASGREVKENFAVVEPREVLERVAELPLRSWNYKAEKGRIRHIGPVAEDFHALFGVGADDKHIATIDADGVALAAIQGLYALIQERDCQIAELERLYRDRDRRLAELGQSHRELEERLRALEAAFPRLRGAGKEGEP